MGNQEQQRSERRAGKIARRVGLAALLAATAIQPARSAGEDAETKSAATRCTAFAGMSQPGVIIRKAEVVQAGTLPAGGGGPPPVGEVPAHCLVQGVINPRTGAGGREFGIGFELRLPLAWNGRFLFQGGAGLDGQIMPAVGAIANSASPPALARGYAVVATDGGHTSSIIDATFGLDQQARVDFAYNALDKVTVQAKRMVGQFYGSGPDRSYFLGCSNGGRQALMASQRLPLEFDGIVSGDPSLGFSRIALGEVWNMQVLARIAPRDDAGRPIYAKAFSDGDLQLVRKAVLKRCDALDNLADGLINDWQKCDFDPAELTCRSGKTDECLTPGQVGALHDLFRGPMTGDGRHIYGPFSYDTGIASPAWRGMRLGTSQTGEPNSADSRLGLGQFRFYQLTPADPDWDPLAPYTTDALLDRIRYTGGIGDADNPLLSTFALHGKMIVYNGMSDQGMATGAIVDWYHKMLAATGEPGRAAVRFFAVPGMLHCGGGEATDQFEMLDAIVDWVENGQAPDRIVATGRAMPGISRPLCPYPKVARYRGGDSSRAESFDCVG